FATLDADVDESRNAADATAAKNQIHFPPFVRWRRSARSVTASSDTRHRLRCRRLYDLRRALPVACGSGTRLRRSPRNPATCAGAGGGAMAQGLVQALDA